MDNSSFLNTSKRFDRNSILEDIEKVEMDSMNRSSFMNSSQNFNASISSHRGLFNDSGMQQKLSARSGGGFSFKIDLNSTKNSQDVIEDKYE